MYTVRYLVVMKFVPDVKKLFQILLSPYTS
jgi:hypothetical protein